MVTVEEAVTNKRCLKYDVLNKRVLAQVGIENMPEVVVMNVHRVNDSLGDGIFMTPRMLGLPGLPLTIYGGPRRGNLKIFGDVSLMVNGNPVMKSENINDPPEECGQRRGWDHFRDSADKLGHRTYPTSES